LEYNRGVGTQTVANDNGPKIRAVQKKNKNQMVKNAKKEEQKSYAKAEKKIKRKKSMKPLINTYANEKETAYFFNGQELLGPRTVKKKGEPGECSKRKSEFSKTQITKRDKGGQKKGRVG